MNDTVPDQLDSIKSHLNEQDKRLVKLETAVLENTELMKDLRDLFTTSKTMTRFIKWTGGLAAAGAAIYLAVKQIFHP